MAECPSCSRDNAYHNGLEYVCPDCGHEWDDGLGLYDDDEDYDDDDEN